MKFNEALEIQGKLANKVNNEADANLYREAWIITSLEEDEQESRMMAEDMIKDLQVEYVNEYDDIFTFIFYLTSGEREEVSYKSDDSYSFDSALDKLYSINPYLCHCKLIAA